MLYRTRPRKNLSNLVWRAADALIAIGGLYCLYLAGSGIWNGEVEIFSKRISGTISWENDPLWFSGMVVAWAGGGIFLLRLAASDK
ncbi:hypothetical protein LJR143_003919 [Pseudoxanthomonas sp. LjRoot143]|uniref:hypothetical protein n=1 Tax=Pseudoxanthomonas sp. LjRoot143 TaxID=3342266 RepID=UPI003ED0A693